MQGRKASQCCSKRSTARKEGNRHPNESCCRAALCTGTASHTFVVVQRVGAGVACQRVKWKDGPQGKGLLECCCQLRQRTGKCCNQGGQHNRRRRRPVQEAGSAGGRQVAPTPGRLRRWQACTAAGSTAGWWRCHGQVAQTCPTTPTTPAAHSPSRKPRKSKRSASTAASLCLSRRRVMWGT